MRTIDEHWGKNVHQSIDIDAVKVINPIVCSGSSCHPVIGDVSLREKIGNVRGWVDDRSPNYPNRTRDVGTSNVRL